MKSFRCGDVVPGCQREFLGADRDAVLAQVAEHARADHHLEPDPALVRAVEDHLRDEADGSDESDEADGSDEPDGTGEPGGAPRRG